jgi:hypothetical protein
MSSLFLNSIQQLTVSKLRLTYSIPPLLVSSSGVFDALNSNNYTIVGPGSPSLALVQVVNGGPSSVDLIFNNPLAIGNWVITVKNVKTATGIQLTTPFSLNILTLTAQQLLTAANGTNTDNSFDVIRKAFNPALQGPGWNALIAAIATGNDYLSQFAQGIFSELFISTATGNFLDQKLEDLGINRPPFLGMPDNVFSKLGIKINSHKLTLESLLEVLDAYYGDDAIRASVDSTITQPYNLTNNSDLLLNIDNTPITVLFHSVDFSNISQATALEVATVINRYFQLNSLNAFAKPIVNPLTGLTIVRIYSSALGLRGKLQILGGLAQNTLQFPTLLATTQAIGTTWQVDTPVSLNTLSGSTLRFTYTAVGTNPTLSLVRIGDYAAIYGSIWNAANIGSFIITNVTTTYFEVSNSLGIAQSPIAQIHNNDIVFYRPTVFNINSKSRISLAAQGIPNVTDIILSATTQAIGRKPFQAAYLSSNPSLSLIPQISLSSGALVRTGGNTVTVTTPSNHTLLTNDLVYLAPGETNFPAGVKTITGTGSNTFTYTESGSNVSSSNSEIVYPNFRDSTGLVHLTTTVNHGFSNNQWIYVDNLINDINTVSGLGFNTTTGSSGNTLYYRQAVLLQNNTILVCGGETSGAAKSNVTYLYNVATNTWSSGPNMNVARSRHTATLLNDGRVLVTGGGSTTGEIYYPSLNIWVNTAPNSISRSDHCATILNDGTVLIAGGGDASYEIFTPSTETWTSNSMPHDVQGAKAILLKTGMVLVAGGFNGGSGTLSTALIYNPYNATWHTTANNMIQPTRYYGAILENTGNDGLVYIVGGNKNAIYWTTVQIFHPSDETWTSGPGLNTGREFPALANLPNNQMIVYGGKTSGAADTATYEILDFINGTAWVSATGAVDQYGSIGISVNNDVLFTAGISISSTSADFLFVPQSVNTVTNSGGFNGLFPLTVTTNNQFQYLTSDYQFISTLNTSHLDKAGVKVTASITPFKAITNTSHIGPYLFDTKDGFPITGISTTTTQAINAGLSYSTITFTDVSKFPNQGYLIFNFGYSNQTAPLQYFAKTSNLQLLVDSSFQFKFNLPVGTKTSVLYSKGAVIPNNPTSLGACYITDSISGRIAAQNTINDVAAAGVIINTTINYPGSIGLGNGDQKTNIITPKVNEIVYIFGTANDVLAARGVLANGVESAV